MRLVIHGLDGSKLSKRHGAININEFKKIGYLPKAIINYLILLGWSPKQNNEIIEFNEIIDKFNIKDISKSSSRFDYTKLNFLNNFYLQQEDNFKDFELFIKHNDSIKLYLNTNIEKIKDIYSAHKRKIKVFNELVEIVKIYFDREKGESEGGIDYVLVNDSLEVKVDSNEVINLTINVSNICFQEFDEDNFDESCIDIYKINGLFSE